MTPSTDLPPAGGALVLGRPSSAAAVDAALRPWGQDADAGYRAEGGRTGWCQLRAAAVTGVRHRLAAETGEDRFAWSHTASRLAVAVCDGLGSVAGAGECAARAAAAAAAAAVSAPGSPSAAARAGVEAANRAAAGEGATTVVIAVIADDGTVGLARVGDSTAFVIGEDRGVWAELFPVGDAGADRVGTETAALPTTELVPDETTLALDPAGVLVLATDGVADPWRDGPGTVAPAMAEGLGARPGPLEVARLADFSRHGCHDDRTLVAVWLDHHDGGVPAEAG